MRLPLSPSLATLLLSVCGCLFHAGAATAAEPYCGETLSASIPPRPVSAAPGSVFSRAIAVLGDDAREDAIRSALIDGDLPDALRALRPVRLRGPRGDHEITLCVMPDYLAVGSDQDPLLIPMRLATALEIASRYGFLLPTRRIVDAIYQQSSIKLRPQPLPAGDSMRSTAYYRRHNDMVLAQRGGWMTATDALLAGDKKDLVLTSRLWSRPDRVAIYGWHRPDGQPIQPLSTVHDKHYADYSHGVRLVSQTAYVDGQPQSLLRLLQDPAYAGVLSDEGPLPRLGELIAELSARTSPRP